MPMDLERISLPAEGAARPVDVVLVHGICIGASLWQPHFLPAFAEAGYNVHAFSLRGHGNSPGQEAILRTTLNDYVSDLRNVLDAIDRPVVAVGYSLGGGVVQEFLRQGGRVEGVILMNSVPPYGLGPSSIQLFLEDPEAWRQLAMVNIQGVTSADPKVLKRVLFTDAMSDEDYAAFLSETCDESPVVGMEFQGWRPIAPLPFMTPPIMIIGGEEDRVVSPADVRATGLYYGVEPTLVAGMSHTMMREPAWRTAFEPMRSWLDERFPVAQQMAA